MQQACKTGAAIAVWYTVSASLSLQNKFLISYYGFHSPVFLALIHVLSCTMFSVALKATGVLSVQAVQSWTTRRQVMVLATLTAGHFVLYFASLRYIVLSMDQEIGATAPVSTAVFAFLIAGTVESLWTYLALVPVTAGIMIACQYEPGVSSVGVALSICGVSLQGCKSTLQGILTSDNQQRLDSFSLLYHVSPLAMVWLLAAAAVLEPESFHTIAALTIAKSSFPWVLLLNGVLAFFGFFLCTLIIEMTSPLTFEVMNNVKGILVTALSMTLFGDAITWQNCLGYGIVLAGALCYSVVKSRSDQSRKRLLPVHPDATAIQDGPVPEALDMTGEHGGGDSTGEPLEVRSDSEIDTTWSEEAKQRQGHLPSANDVDAPLLTVQGEFLSERRTY
eukprot:jgi/Ulvmu1/8609/UM046_0007.1